MTWSDSLGRIAAQLSNHRPSLYPTEELDDLIDLKISKLSTDSFGEEQRSFAIAVKAGLHVWNESLDDSHELSQQLHTREGSYWHGMMHRMEGDYSNADYWFRMAGGHPAETAWGAACAKWTADYSWDNIASVSLREAIRSWAQRDRPDAIGFCELVRLQVTKARDENAEQLLKELQREEILTLLQACYANSGGGSLFDNL
ncbi:hypothetical protein [Paenibacillus sp. YYML68]|uniref:hypothetical protein n=1 Tax=Paenibacillus sp. YYML68 TaxID=2909250 RepID=UPI002491516A|nr:hypothetical protein [Paenibacillus sp. YYML68]